MSILFPIRGSYTFKRVDKGQDFLTKPGSALVAVVSGTLATGNDPKGFGPRYPILHGDDGKSYYYGHVDIAPGLVGKRVKAGDTIAHTSTTPRGNASQPGWFEFGDASLLGVGGETGGSAISAELHQATGKGGGPSVFDAAAAAIPGVGPLIAGADAVGLPNPAQVEGDVAGSIVDALANALGIHAGRIMLYVVLIGAGVALAVAGVSRAAGVTAGDIKTAAKLGAAA